jgi:hypothetical protein
MVWAQWGGDCECLWITGLTGLRAQVSGAEIVQVCAGLRGVPQQSGDHACLWIPSLAGLRNAVRWRSCGSEG